MRYTVTGLSGSCMHIEQFKLPSRMLRTSLSVLTTSRLLALALPLKSSCRCLAFSCSVSDESDSMARMAAIKSLPDDEEAAVAFCLTATRGASGGKEQSGHSQLTASAMELGGAERQVTCQGVAQVLQRRDSFSDGFVLHTIQTPSPSHGRSLSCAIGVVEDSKYEVKFRGK